MAALVAAAPFARTAPGEVVRNLESHPPARRKKHFILEKGFRHARP